jgi:predicted thioesterase
VNRKIKRHLLLALLLTVLSASPALAGWLKMASNEVSVFYLESPTPKKVGTHVMIRVLRDHTSAQFAGAGAYLSSIDEIEVDCERQRIRRLYSSDHPQHMGEGKFVNSEHGPMSWNAVVPGTIVQRIVDIACLQG